MCDFFFFWHFVFFVFKDSIETKIIRIWIQRAFFFYVCLEEQFRFKKEFVRSLLFEFTWNIWFCWRREIKNAPCTLRAGYSTHHQDSKEKGEGWIKNELCVGVCVCVRKVGWCCLICLSLLFILLVDFHRSVSLCGRSMMMGWSYRWRMSFV